MYRIQGPDLDWLKSCGAFDHRGGDRHKANGREDTVSRDFETFTSSETAELDGEQCAGPRGVVPSKDLPDLPGVGFGERTRPSEEASR